MRVLEIAAKISILDDIELTAEQKNVIEAAKKATFQSYCPYSHFHVGAACLLDNGQMVSGSNQENAAYPSGLCAERTALFYAQSAYPEAHVTMLAIAARDTEGKWCAMPTSPCGACRQVMAEVEQRSGRRIQILLPSAQGNYLFEGTEVLLPFTFSDRNLK